MLACVNFDPNPACSNKMQVDEYNDEYNIAEILYRDSHWESRYPFAESYRANVV